MGERCQGCGYDLDGHREAEHPKRCPECGHHQVPGGPDAIESNLPSNNRSLAVGLIPVLACVGATIVFDLRYSVFAVFFGIPMSAIAGALIAGYWKWAAIRRARSWTWPAARSSVVSVGIASLLIYLAVGYGVVVGLIFVRTRP